MRTEFINDDRNDEEVNHPGPGAETVYVDYDGDGVVDAVLIDITGDGVTDVVLAAARGCRDRCCRQGD